MVSRQLNLNDNTKHLDVKTYRQKLLNSNENRRGSIPLNVGRGMNSQRVFEKNSLNTPPQGGGRNLNANFYVFFGHDMPIYA